MVKKRTLELVTLKTYKSGCTSVDHVSSYVIFIFHLTAFLGEDQMGRSSLILFPSLSSESADAGFNPLGPNSDLSQTSHCNIKSLSVSEVMRIENMITQVKFY